MTTRDGLASHLELERRIVEMILHGHGEVLRADVVARIDTGERLRPTDAQKRKSVREGRGAGSSLGTVAARKVKNAHMEVGAIWCGSPGGRLHRGL